LSAHTTHRKSSSRADGAGLRVLLLGFGLVALLVAALTAYGLQSHRQMQNHLDTIVHEHTRHIQLLHGMEQLIHKRALLSYEIVQAEDAFERDDKIQEFHDAASKFMVARQTLTEMTLTQEERRLLAAQNVISGGVRQLQQQMIELALADKRQQANQLLLEQAIPGQAQAMAVLMDLIRFNRTQIEQVERSALRRSQQQERVLIVAGGLAVLLTLIIGWQVWRRMCGLVGRLQQAHRELGDSMRALEYQKIAMDEHAIISVADPAGLITSVNEKFCQISQYRAEELIGHKHNILNSGHHPPEFFAAMWQTIARGDVWHGTIRNRRKDGSFYWVATSIVPFLDAAGKPYQYVSIRTDVTQLLETEQSLLAAKEVAEHANRAKSQFLASMSHEMRTPMNAVLGFAQLIEMDPALSPDQRDNVSEILKAGRHLLDLITEVLNLEKIESGNIELALEPVVLSDVVDECLALIQPLAVVQDIQIGSAGCANVVLCTDRMRLKQVLINLLSNAVKYNRRGGSVQLTCTDAAGPHCRILVRDSGQGIPQQRLAEVFQPFNRLGAESGAIHGSGIGLTISRQLVELLGGAIGVESTEGVGSTFWIELPRERRQAAREPGRELESIFYIGDNQANLKQLSRLLGQRPHIRLKTAHTALVNDAPANENAFDLILLDLGRPYLENCEALVTQLRQGGLNARTWVVALVDDISRVDVERCQALGIHDFLTKPIRAADLFNVIDRRARLAEQAI